MQTPLDTAAERRLWSVRIAAVTSAMLLAGALIAFGSGPHGLVVPLFLAAALAFFALAMLGRSAIRRAIELEAAAALLVLSAAQLALYGVEPSWGVAAYAPLIVIVAAAVGPVAAFIAADAVALGWALVTGLAAGGLLGPVIGLSQPPELTLLSLGLVAVFLNAVAVVTGWAMENAQPALLARLRSTEADRDQLARQLEATQPLATAGRLVANVAHEVSNPLQAMDHFLFVLRDETPETDARREHLEFLKQGIDRITQYVEQLSQFYRPTRGGGAADVNRVVGDVCGFLERQLRNANVKLSLELASELPMAGIGEEQLRQALLNVLLNAADAMPDGGDLTVSTGLSEEGLVVAIEDTGFGIPPADMERIFEPFFTTREEKGGTGLGLSITQRILRSGGGDISVDSTVSAGTLVTLVLPASGD